MADFCNFLTGWDRASEEKPLMPPHTAGQGESLRGEGLPCPLKLPRWDRATNSPPCPPHTITARVDLMPILGGVTEGAVKFSSLQNSFMFCNY